MYQRRIKSNVFSQTMRNWKSFKKKIKSQKKKGKSQLKRCFKSPSILICFSFETPFSIEIVESAFQLYEYYSVSLESSRSNTVDLTLISSFPRRHFFLPLFPFLCLSLSFAKGNPPNIKKKLKPRVAFKSATEQELKF